MNFKVYKTLILSFCIIYLFILSGCKQDSSESNTNETTTTTQTQINNITYLKVISKYDGSYTGSNGNHGYIYRIGLAGYNFEDLKIEYNESKTFELNGIPGGFDNVNVSVSFRPDSTHIAHNNPAEIKCNFSKGETTTLTLASGGTLQVSY